LTVIFETTTCVNAVLDVDVDAAWAETTPTGIATRMRRIRYR
jgi:hypothetical protein